MELRSTDHAQVAARLGPFAGHLARTASNWSASDRETQARSRAGRAAQRRKSGVYPREYGGATRVGRLDPVSALRHRFVREIRRFPGRFRNTDPVGVADELQ